MFKKAVDAKSQQRLSGADRKKLRRTIKEKFRNVSDADIDTLLPPKVDITVAKYPNRILVYGLEGGCPMFFYVDGRNIEIFPTVYALWSIPDLLPAFVLKGGEVSRFVIGGADLMFPGISIPAEGLPSFLAGQIWAVKVPGNPAPIAVGTTTMSSSEALKAGLRGKALKIIHYYRDMLWESAENPYVPNAGFLEDIVFEDPTFGSECQASDSGENDVSNDQGNAIDNEATGDGVDIKETPFSVDPTSTTQNVVTTEATEQAINDLDGLKVTENASANEPSMDDQHSMSVEDMDALLDKCLLQALHTSVKDKDLPMPGSTLWSGHVLPCRPSDIALDVKKSSYKKLSKWLQYKASTSLITVKEDKHKKEVTLFAVNRNHPDYTTFKPEKRKAEKKEVATDNAADEGQTHKILEVCDIYKSTVHVNPIFAAVGADPKKLFTASEASEIVFQYVEKENLVKPTDKSTVVLDPILCDALFKGTNKYPTEIHKRDLGATFINRMQVHHIVARGNHSVVRKGALKPIQIMTERRQGNKKVTRLSGLEIFLIDAEALASELQKKCACSTTVAELPGKKGFEVLVQGGVIDDLARHLIEQYGIQKRYIEVLDKTKK